MFLRERGVFVATVLSGMVLVGCSSVQKPNFPSCYDDSDPKREDPIYLREGTMLGLFGINRELQIGEMNLKRDTKTGEVILTEGKKSEILDSNSVLEILEQPDGREYVLSFVKHDKYIRVGIESTCIKP